MAEPPRGLDDRLLGRIRAWRADFYGAVEARSLARRPLVVKNYGYMSASSRWRVAAPSRRSQSLRRPDSVRRPVHPALSRPGALGLERGQLSDPLPPVR
jgi:hypothetical protein